MWCWGRMEKISWTDRVKNEEALQRVQRERNIAQTVKSRKAVWMGHILRRNCLMQHFIKGNIKGTGIRRRIPKQLVHDFQKKRGYLKLNEKAPDSVLWRTGCGRGCGPFVRQTAE